MTTPTEPAPPLTDDQLRQVAAAMAIEYGRDQADDVMGIGEMLSDTVDEVLEIAVPAALDPDLPDFDNDVYDEVTGRIADLIRTATITVTWPDTRPRVVVWDWRQQLPLDQLRAALTTGLVHLHEVDTGSDQFAIVLAATPLATDAVKAAYDNRHGEEA